MTDRNEPPVREALVKNADNVTTDLHIACRAENERLRAALEKIHDTKWNVIGGGLVACSMNAIARKALIK